jgi:hypothetical protein
LLVVVSSLYGSEEMFFWKLLFSASMLTEESIQERIDYFKQGAQLSLWKNRPNYSPNQF